MKQINFEPKNKLKAGLDRVADAVKLTIGPMGRNVAIERGAEPLITNDGGTIAHEIILGDKDENMGAQIVRGVIRKTSEKVGGGRTASAILTQAIVKEGLKQAQFGININEFKRGMAKAVSDITEELKKNAKEVQSKEELEQIATISTEDKKLGATIADVVWQTGKDSIVTVEESQGLDITTEVVDGVKFDKGWVSPYMVTNPERMEAELKDVPVLVTDKKISIYKEIYPIIEKLAGKGKNSLLVVCEDFEGDALNNSVLMKIRGVFNLVAVKFPLIGKDDWIEDIAKSVGTEIISDKTGFTYANIGLGLAKKAIVSKDSTVIMGSADIKDHLRNLKLLAENTENVVEKDKLERRIAVLGGGIAVIKVGASTEAEMKYLKQKIEDGVNESKRALEEGVVAGGDVAFVNAVKSLELLPESDQGMGYNTVVSSVSEPFKQIIRNAQGSPEVILNQITTNKSKTIGYNAITDKIEEDMFKAGIIDALKVVRTVLENAVSGAGMFLTIEATVNEKVEEKTKLEY
jgi:chaperonin GroEL